MKRRRRAIDPQPEAVPATSRFRRGMMRAALVVGIFLAVSILGGAVYWFVGSPLRVSAACRALVAAEKPEHWQWARPAGYIRIPRSFLFPPAGDEWCGASVGNETTRALYASTRTAAAAIGGYSALFRAQKRATTLAGLPDDPHELCVENPDITEVGQPLHRSDCIRPLPGGGYEIEFR